MIRYDLHLTGKTLAGKGMLNLRFYCLETSCLYAKNALIQRKTLYDLHFMKMSD